MTQIAIKLATAICKKKKLVALFLHNISSRVIMASVQNFSFLGSLESAQKIMGVDGGSQDYLVLKVTLVLEWVV